MEVTRTGLILYVKHYEACLQFYAEILELPVLFSTENLTSFDFFGTYLMVEKEDRVVYLKDISEMKNTQCIRMNVVDVFGVSESLKSKNIQIDYQEHSWGNVAKFKDPEGNLLAFKDEEGFAKQIEEYEN
jgi:lactoylglutathione lyase